MKPFFLAAILILLNFANLNATEALIFDAGGYNIQILVGYTDHPIVAQVRFTPPGAKDWVNLPEKRLRIEKFDFQKQVLILHFLRGNNSDLPASFSLSAEKDKAILLIGDKEVKSTIDWDI